MDIYLYLLREYDIKDKDIREIPDNIRLIDFFLPRKRMINSTFFMSDNHFDVMDKLISSNGKLTNINVNSIYVLRAFGVSTQVINKLIGKKVYNIEEAKTLTEVYFKKELEFKTSSSYEKFSKQLQAYDAWLNENKLIRAELLSSLYLIENKSITQAILLEKLKNEIESFDDHSFEYLIQDMESNEIIAINNEEILINYYSVHDYLMFNNATDLKTELANNKSEDKSKTKVLVELLGDTIESINYIEKTINNEQEISNTPEIENYLAIKFNNSLGVKTKCQADLDILFFSLKEYGVTSKQAKSFSKNFQFSDFLYPNSGLVVSENFLYKNYKALFSVFKSNKIYQNPELFDSIYLLEPFGLSAKILNLLENQNLKTISKLRNLSKNEKFNFKFQDKNLKEIKEAITEYDNWIYKNKLYYIKLLILFYFRNEQLEDLYLIIQNKMKNYNINLNLQIFYEVITDLKASNGIEIENNILVFKPLNLEALLNLEIEDSDMFNDYINSFSMEEIAKNQEKPITRSRVQQILGKIFDGLPLLEEDIKYSKIFNTYNFTKKEFTQAFAESGKTFEYLNYKYRKNKSKRKQFNTFLLEGHLPDDRLKRLLLENKYFLTFNQTIRRITKGNLIGQYFFNNKGKRLLVEETLNEFNLFCTQYNIEGYGQNLRNYKSTLERNPYLLSSNDGTARYFNTESLDERDLESILESFNLTEGIYGSDKIFELNKKTLEELNIENGEELLDLYKKMKMDHDDVNKIVRRSEVYIGVMNKDDFILDILFEFENENLNTVTQYLEKEYGLHRGSLLGYIQQKFPELLLNNIIILEEPETSNQEIMNYIDTNYDSEIYLLNSINHDLTKEFNEKISINNLTLQYSNYKVDNGYMIGKKFNSPLDAMRHHILKNDSFYRIPSELYKSNAFSNAFYRLQENLEIIKVSDIQFISSKKLIKSGIYREDINNFVENVLQFTGGLYEYFSYKTLTNHNFKHNLQEYGFDYSFYESILTYSNRFNVINTQPRVFFAIQKEKHNLKDFLYKQLQRFEVVDYIEFLDFINDEFGIVYERFKLLDILSDSDAYYSNETEKFYADKDLYYSEVYGK